LKVALYQAQAEKPIPGTDSEEDEPAAAPPSMAEGIIEAVRNGVASFNTSIVFFFLAVALLAGALIIRGRYVREYRQQTYGNPYPVHLERQRLNVTLYDNTNAHALSAAELSYPIYQALTFAGHGHSHHVEAISAADVQSGNGRQVIVQVRLQGGEARDFPVDLGNSSGIRDLQNYLFDGDFQAAADDAVAIPSIFTTALLAVFVAAGLFILYGLWKLVLKLQEISSHNRLLDAAGALRIVKGLRNDPEALRNLETLSSRNPLGEELRQAAGEQARLAELEEREESQDKRRQDHSGNHS